jgi:hypothetical protein
MIKIIFLKLKIQNKKHQNNFIYFIFVEKIFYYINLEVLIKSLLKKKI